MNADYFMGIALHFRPNDKNVSACGIINPQCIAHDARDINCRRCKKTKKYKIYMGINKWLK
jgi:hypothetical protein